MTRRRRSTASLARCLCVVGAVLLGLSTAATPVAAAPSPLADVDPARLLGVADVGITPVGSSANGGAVTQFTTDAQGFVWYASPDGIGRIDGFDIQLASLADRGGQPTAETASIAADPKIGIWLAAGTLFHFDPWTRTLTEFDVPASRIAAVETGLWIWRPDELSFFEFTSRRVVTTIPLLKDSIDSTSAQMVVDDHDNIYVASHRWVVIASTDGTVVERVISGGITAIASRAGGGIWVAGPAGLWIQESTTRARLVARAPDTLLPGDGLVQFSADRVLVSLNDGSVAAFDPTTDSWLGSYRPPSGDTAPITHLFVSSSEDLWMARHGVGVVHFDPSDSALDFHPYPDLDPPFVLGAVIDTPDGIVVANEQGDIWLLDREALQWRRQPSRAEEFFYDGQKISGLVLTEASIWVAVRTRQVVEVPRDDKLPIRRIEFGAVETVELHPNHDEIWLFNRNQELIVQRLDGASRSQITFPGGNLSFAGVDFLDGRAYLLSPNALRVLDDDRFELVAEFDVSTGLPDLPFTAIHVHRADQVYVGTASGLLVLDPTSGEWELLDEARGIPTATIRAIVAHPTRDALWLATSTRLVLFDLTTNRATATFTLRQGLMAPTFLEQSLRQLENGSLALATNAGLAIINPDFPTGPDSEPAQAYTECVVGCTDYDGVTIRDADELTFRIMVPSGVAQEGFQIEYRLDGYDDDWRSATTGQLVSYRNLAAGTYQFRVRTSGASGEVTEVAAGEPGGGFRIQISTPLLDRPDIRLGAILVIAALIGGFLMIRTINARRRERRMEMIVVERTAEAQQARVDAEAANEVKTRFLSTVTHELRTPLTSILGFAELATEASGPDRDRYIRNIGSAGEHLAQMIEDLILVARGEISTLEAHISESVVVVSDLVDELGSLVQPQLRQAGISLRFTDRYRRSALLPLDKIAVRQILINLIGNAIQHSGGSRIDVSVTPVTTEIGQLSGLRFAVRDDGGSLPSDDVGAITARFRRGSTARGDGMGLGLSIANQLIVAAGSELKVNVIEGSSTVFSFLLQATEAPPSAGARLPSADVWVVDDHRASREVIGEMLRGVGLEVREFADGDAVIRALSTGAPRIVFTDIMMSPIDGVELAHRLRVLATHPMRIVAVTGVPEEIRDRPVFDAILVKPLRIQDIRRIIGEMMATT